MCSTIVLEFLAVVVVGRGDVERVVRSVGRKLVDIVVVIGVVVVAEAIINEIFVGPSELLSDSLLLLTRIFC